MLAVVALLALVAAGCGGDGAAPDGRSPNGVDRAFAADMVPHHASAIEMARIAERRARARPVRELARAIGRGQEAEIAVLRRADRRLAAAGVERGDLGVPGHMMGMDGDVASLRTARPFDRAFLEMMIPHHEGAIAMARAELAEGGDPELRELAQRIVTVQEREIRAMRSVLRGDGATEGDGGPVIPDGGQAGGHSG